MEDEYRTVLSECVGRRRDANGGGIGKRDLPQPGAGRSLLQRVVALLRWPGRQLLDAKKQRSIEMVSGQLPVMGHQGKRSARQQGLPISSPGRALFQELEALLRYRRRPQRVDEALGWRSAHYL